MGSIGGFLKLGLAAYYCFVHEFFDAHTRQNQARSVERLRFERLERARHSGSVSCMIKNPSIWIDGVKVRAPIFRNSLLDLVREATFSSVAVHRGLMNPEAKVPVTIIAEDLSGCFWFRICVINLFLRVSGL